MTNLNKIERKKNNQGQHLIRARDHSEEKDMKMFSQGQSNYQIKNKMIYSQQDQFRFLRNTQEMFEEEENETCSYDEKQSLI